MPLHILDFNIRFSKSIPNDFNHNRTVRLHLFLFDLLLCNCRLPTRICAGNQREESR